MMANARITKSRTFQRSPHKRRFTELRGVNSNSVNRGGTSRPTYATGATAGIPGGWTPNGATAPASPTDLSQARPNTVVASPATAWTSGQYVQTRTAGAAGRATWTGSAWVSGAAPLAAGGAFDPGEVTVAEAQQYVEDHPDQRQAVLAAEQAGKNRSTLIAWLQGE
jgi:hypothetical protein